MQNIITKKHLCELWDQLDPRGRADLIVMGETLYKAMKDHPECSTHPPDDTLEFIQRIREGKL